MGQGVKVRTEDRQCLCWVPTTCRGWKRLMRTRVMSLQPQASQARRQHRAGAAGGTEVGRHALCSGLVLRRADGLEGPLGPQVFEELVGATRG